MYDRMAKEADEEGFTEIAAKFRGIGVLSKKSMKQDSEDY